MVSKLDSGQTLQGAYDDANQAFKFENVGSLVPMTYDSIVFSYTGNNITTAVYKTGGLSGTTVATLTLTYSGSNVTSVTRT